MTAIKNCHKISVLIPLNKVGELESEAKRLSKTLNISFSVVEVEMMSIIIKVKQGKNALKNYYTEDYLISLTKDVFSRFLNLDIVIKATPYLESVIDIVNPQWINERMTQLKLKLSDIEHDTGINRKQLSDWLLGREPTTQAVKAMFYYYFKNR